LEVSELKTIGIILILVLIGICFFLVSHHVVTSESGKFLIRKKGVRFSETFVDVRGWEPQDLDEHPALVDALIAAGHRDVVDGIAGVEELEEPAGAPATGGLGGVMDPVIESQSPAGSQKTGGRLKDRAKAAGGK
jgi:hypothetical protein